MLLPPYQSTCSREKKRKVEQATGLTATTQRLAPEPLLIPATFAFYPRKEFKDASIHQVVRGKDMLWRFNLAHHVETLLARHQGHICIHGYRCEEYQSLPGVPDESTIPYFVATCLPPEAPAPSHVLVKDATQSTGVTRIVDMSELPLQWVNVAGSDRVSVLRSFFRSKRGMKDEQKKLVEAA